MILIKIVDICFGIYMIMLFIRIMSSWFPEYRDHTFVRFIAFYTDPYLNIFRRIIPPLGMFDLSPIVAFFALQILEAVVKSLLITIIL
jgi:YggT family protein